MTGYTIGPDVTMQLACDEELIRVGRQILAPALFRPQLAVAPLPGSTPR